MGEVWPNRVNTGRRMWSTIGDFSDIAAFAGTVRYDDVVAGPRLTLTYDPRQRDVVPEDAVLPRMVKAPGEPYTGVDFTGYVIVPVERIRTINGLTVIVEPEAPESGTE